MAANNAHVTGADLSGSFLQSSHGSVRVDPDIENEIHSVHPNRTPFLTILNSIGPITTVGQTSFVFQQQQEIAFVTTVNGTINNSNQALVLTDDTFWLQDDVLLNINTREQMRVESARSTTLSVTRGFLSSADSATDGDVIINLGALRAEGASKGEQRARNTASVTKYVSHVEAAIGLTNIAELQDVRGPSELSRLQRQNISHFNNVQERQLIFSQTGTATDQNISTPVTAMEGLREYAIAANSTAIAGAGVFDYDTLIAAIQPIAEPGQNIHRVALGGLTVMTQLSQLAEIRTLTRFNTPGDGSPVMQLGFKVVRLTGPGVELDIIEDKVMDEAGASTELIIFDPTNIKIREMQGITLTPNIQATGAYRNEWRLHRIFGLQVDVPDTCGIITNMVSAGTPAS